MSGFESSFPAIDTSNDVSTHYWPIPCPMRQACEDSWQFGGRHKRPYT